MLPARPAILFDYRALAEIEQRVQSAQSEQVASEFPTQRAQLTQRAQKGRQPKDATLERSAVAGWQDGLKETPSTGIFRPVRGPDGRASAADGHRV